MAHTDCSVTHTLLDIGLHSGAPVNYPSADGTVVENTQWLKGPGTDSYPGTLTPFQAANSTTNEVPSQVRLISVRLETTGTGITFDVNAYDSNLNFVYCLLSAVNDTDTDESLLAAATVVAQEAGTVAMTVGGSGDDVLLTLIAA